MLLFSSLLVSWPYLVPTCCTNFFNDVLVWSAASLWPQSKTLLPRSMNKPLLDALFAPECLCPRLRLHIRPCPRPRLVQPHPPQPPFIPSLLIVWWGGLSWQFYDQSPVDALLFLSFSCRSYKEFLIGAILFLSLTLISLSAAVYLILGNVELCLSLW